jgi:hypothetical protein
LASEPIDGPDDLGQRILALQDEYIVFLREHVEKQRLLEEEAERALETLRAGREGV